jgi:hypothetical protein
LEDAGNPGNTPPEHAETGDYGDDLEAGAEWGESLWEDGAEPDLSEQEAAMAQRISAQRQAADPDNFEALEPEGEFAYGEEPEYEEEVPHYGTPPGFETNGAHAPHDPRLDQIETFLVAKARQENAKALNDLADARPQLRDPEVLEEVAEHLDDLAERTGAEDIQMDPRVVEHALDVVMARRTLERLPPAEVASQQGATLETDAGASVPQGGELSYEDERRKAIRSAGRTADDPAATFFGI